MALNQPSSKKKNSIDWFFQGILTKLGDTVDRFTGRRWTPSSSLAASELIERLKKLLDAEAKSVPGKGLVVPHNIKLRMQWDKFSDDADTSLKKLEIELLTAAVDHINDSLYYTFAPVTLDVKTDYFVEGVKLNASFEDFTEEDRNVELNVTIPAMNVSSLIPETPQIGNVYLARFELKSVPMERRLEFPAAGSVSVGRTGSNQLVIDDASVSKIHASLSVSPDNHLLVADTGSTNGTFINDVRITYGKATAIDEADLVKFGLIEVQFEYVAQPIPIPLAESANETVNETVEIDGFVFRGGSSPEPESQIETVADIPIPDETLRVDLSSGRAKSEKGSGATIDEAQGSSDDEGPETKY